MDFTLNKPYDLSEVADALVKNMILSSQKIIGITGTSSVGKSTLTRLLKERLEQQFSVQVIGVDSYLKEEYRGATKFWNYSEDYLKPAHFDWERLWKDIICLQQGERIEQSCYVRGIGWSNKRILTPADFLIIEGLFMDSVEASECMEYELLIILSAEDEFIRRLRIERDDYFRKNYKNFTRTEEETLKEIENTLLAGKSYQTCVEKWNYLVMFRRDDYRVEVISD